MSDLFKDFAPGLESPATHAIEIVPDDTNDIAMVTRGLNVTTDGAVRVTTQGGEVVTLFIAAGGAFPIRIRRVWATGTSATGIVGLY